jgi:hypothetical protein
MEVTTSLASVILSAALVRHPVIQRCLNRKPKCLARRPHTSIDRGTWSLLPVRGSAVGEGTCIDCWGGMRVRGCRIRCLRFVCASISGRLFLVCHCHYYQYYCIILITYTKKAVRYNGFIRFYFNRNYDSILNYAFFKTLYYGRQHLGTWFSRKNRPIVSVVALCASLFHF